jgi:hypothetical protein
MFARSGKVGNVSLLICSSIDQDFDYHTYGAKDQGLDRMRWRYWRACDGV